MGSQANNIEETSTGCLNLAAPLFGLIICRTGKQYFLDVVFLGSVIPRKHRFPVLHMVRPKGGAAKFRYSVDVSSMFFDQDW